MAGTTTTADTATSAFDRVLHDVGSAIAHGDLPVGSIETVDGLVARTGASRSVVREATRVLGSLGMIAAGRRVGLRVRPTGDWDVLDPLVIRWRLDGPDRAAQLDELRALRRAVEPEAARAAALAAPDPAASAALRAVAERLADATHGVEAGGASRPEGAPPGTGGAEAGAASRPTVRWAEADRDLHALVLGRSGNVMFQRLQAVIDEALEERRSIGPDPHDVALHVAVARAVGAGDPDTAAAAMREIVDRTS